MIAFQATKRGLTDRETTMEDTHVWVMNADGTGRREVGAAIDNRQGAPEWTADGSAVLFTVQERGNVRLYRVPVTTSGGGKPEVARQRARHGRHRSRRRRTSIAYTLADAVRSAGAVCRAARKLTDLNASLLGGKPHRRGRVVHVRVQRQQVRGRGVPDQAGRSRARRRKYPLIVNIHGGPHGQQGPAFNFKNQVYAARGWATLMVNYRGSTGYGQAFADAVFADQNGNEGQDVLYGVERGDAALPVDRSRSARRRGDQLRRSAVDLADHADQHLQGGDSRPRRSPTSSATTT